MADRAQVEAILGRYQQRALTPAQAILILASETEGAPLDPERADDAAVLLRAELWVAAGESVRTALARASGELLDSRRRPPGRRQSDYIQTNSFPTSITSGPLPDAVFCGACGSEKSFVAQAGFAYPRCGHRPIALARPVAVEQPSPRARRNA